MTGTTATMNGTSPHALSDALTQRVRFVEQAGRDQAIVLAFADPVPAKAVRASADAEDVADLAPPLDVLVLHGQPTERPEAAEALTRWVAGDDGAAVPLTITLHGTLLVWRPGRAALLAAPERADALVQAVVEFTYYEAQLGAIERETAAGWPRLEADTPLAFEVKANDPKRLAAAGSRLQWLLGLRMKHARLVPHLVRPPTYLATLAHQLGERLRERARVEDRLETLTAQLEVYDRVYDLCVQRISDHRTSRREQSLEWIIICLLAADTILLLIEVFLSLERH
jgi:hypothetical protein